VLVRVAELADALA